MIVENLELNKEITKSKLCELLGVKKATGGRNIKLQDAEIARYIKVEKVSRYKIKVVEIYETIIIKIDNRGKSIGSRNNNKGIYTKYCTKILLQYLNTYKRNNRNILYATTNQLAERIGIINCNYTKANANKQKFGNYMYNKNRFTNYTARKDMFDALYNIVKPTIVGTLEKLQKNGDITYLQTYLIHNKNYIRASTLKETKIIKIIQAEVLVSMDIKNKLILQNDNKLQKKYYSTVEGLVMEQIDMDYYITGFKITICDKEIEEFEDINNIKVVLNNIIIKRALLKIEKKINNLKIKMGGGFDGLSNCKLERWDRDKIKEEYKIEAEELIKSLIKLGYLDIRFAIEETKIIERG
ncbi:hypothetical protein LL037_21520 [Clostridium estertheticum]|uniref:hypothetical protein n=1 Tax=Clostridium estertheticum TaxID=238834 RepID=UPI001C0C15DC|nr:hypothetical protein [Clostridium estertheticum]MBU3198323.1 hypothetical protein [Clostridium estertheticum]WAG65010.1 hypothetical protein LL037_21520 [Clostridium estertheticum]